MERPNEDLMIKYESLVKHIQSMGSVAVAFSGGVDSTFLLYAALEALKQRDKIIAVTASSCSFPERELREATEFCEEMGIDHITVKSEELEIEGFRNNPVNRCYLCKSELFAKIREVADNRGLKEIVEGSNLDDNGDYRPGLQAIKELGIRSPLREAGFTKDDIRILSREFGLPTWDKQSFACLASRFPYGELITELKLGMVDRAEQFLLDQGFNQIRVRIHGNVARIEIMPEDFIRFMEYSNRNMVYDKLREIGFSYVALDLKGYRTGSMNETLSQEDKAATNHPSDN